MTELNLRTQDLTRCRQIVAHCMKVAMALAVWIGLAITITVVGCFRGDAEPARDRLLIAAASSLRELCEGTGPAFLRDHPNVELVFSFGASSKLARQMEASGEFDVLLSADALTLERIASSVDAGSVVPFLSNRIALVAREGLVDPVDSLDDLPGRDGRIAVAAEPVPAGRYARELLDRRGLLARLDSRLVSADNVRIALAMVKSGATDYGLVYQSDARAAPVLGVCWIAPPGELPKIEYVAATRSNARPIAAAYLRFMRGPEAQEAASRLGFEGVP